MNRLARVFSYSTIVLVFYPLCFLGLLLGGLWPWLCFLFILISFVLADRYLPPLANTPVIHDSQWYYLFPILHIPCALLGLILLLLQTNSNQLSIANGMLQHSGTDMLEIIGCVLLYGLLLSGNTVAAHELIHQRQDKLKLELGRILLAVQGDAQFALSHVFGHHRHVGMPQDCSTARRGETAYAFFLRSGLGAYAVAYHHERLRGRALLSPSNELSRGFIYTVAIIISILPWSSWTALLSYLLSMSFAKLLLETTNYIQHYGLVRDEAEDINDTHSWPCYNRASHYVLYGLSQHAHHHRLMALPYWRLQDNIGDGRPHLDIGYMAAIQIALVPPLWFSYMQPKLQLWDELRHKHKLDIPKRSLA